MQSRRILITFNNNKYRTLDKTCIETREMLLRDKISLISISCVICFTKVGHLCCWRLQRHRGFGRDRNKNAISVVFSSTVKPGIRLAQFSFPFRSVQPSSCCGGWFRCLITYVRTCVCSYVYQRDESRVQEFAFANESLETGSLRESRLLLFVEVAYRGCLTRCVGESAMGKIYYSWKYYKLIARNVILIGNN